jgi:hypothetical protein
MSEDLGWQLSTAVVLFHEAVGRRLGLSAADHKALGLIARQGPMPAGALAAQLGVGASAVTGVVDRLVAAGHARRTADPADRRRVLIEADRPDLGDVFADLGREMAAVMAKYDERELAAILDYVASTVEVLKEQTRRLAGDGPHGRASQDAR